MTIPETNNNKEINSELKVAVETLQQETDVFSRNARIVYEARVAEKQTSFIDINDDMQDLAKKQVALGLAMGGCGVFMMAFGMNENSTFFSSLGLLYTAVSTGLVVHDYDKLTEHKLLGMDLRSELQKHKEKSL